MAHPMLREDKCLFRPCQKGKAQYGFLRPKGNTCKISLCRMGGYG